jgi:hypothetical protein
MTTIQRQAPLHSQWVSAFIDAEGTFAIGINKKKDMKLGYQVILEFVISQHKRDQILLENIKVFFGECGYIAKDGANMVQYRIRAVKDVTNVLIPHLAANPLLTQKRLDAAAFMEVHALMVQGKHLTPEGLEIIRRIKSTMNRARMVQYKIVS